MRQYLQKTDGWEKAQVAAGFQEAVVDVLMHRVQAAVEQTGIRRIAIGGGVAANGGLRAALIESPWEVFIPPRHHCSPTVGSPSFLRFGVDACHEKLMAAKGIDVEGVKSCMKKTGTKKYASHPCTSVSCAWTPRNILIRRVFRWKIPRSRSATR